MKEKTKQIHAYKVGLMNMSRNGGFSCPKCGTKISPDDCSEEVYSISDVTIDDYGLEEVVIHCNKCTSQIHITGFSAAQKMLDAP